MRVKEREGREKRGEEGRSGLKKATRPELSNTNLRGLNEDFFGDSLCG